MHQHESIDLREVIAHAVLRQRSKQRQQEDGVGARSGPDSGGKQDVTEVGIDPGEVDAHANTEAIVIASAVTVALEVGRTFLEAINEDISRRETVHGDVENPEYEMGTQRYRLDQT